MKTFVLREDRHAALLWEHLKKWREYAAAGKPIQVDIGTEKKVRSQEQNRLYWAVLSAIEETGELHGQHFTREAWHFFFRTKFLPCTEGPGGTVVPVSTATLEREPFSDYINQVQAWAAEKLQMDFREVA